VRAPDSTNKTEDQRTYSAGRMISYQYDGKGSTAIVGKLERA
jgi:hypothetical protein